MILQPSEFRYLNYCDNDVLLVLRSARHIERLLNAYDKKVASDVFACGRSTIELLA